MKSQIHHSRVRTHPAFHQAQHEEAGLGISPSQKGILMNLPSFPGSNVTVCCNPKEMSDELLVEAAKSGDAAAFVELSGRHSSKLLRTLYRITRNWEGAEDMLQKSFLKAFIHLRKFEGRSSLLILAYQDRHQFGLNVFASEACTR